MAYNSYTMLHFYKEAINAICRCLPLTDRLASMRSPMMGGPRGDGFAKRQQDISSNFIDKLLTNLNECAMVSLIMC